MELEKALEALLFVAGEALGVKDVVRIIGCDKKDLERTITTLEASLPSHGMRLVRQGEMLTLATAPEVSDVVRKFTQEELQGDLSRASLETLAIILWKGTVSRAGIDYIRGVNSAFALRTLLIRGFVEREHDERDARVYLYRPTIDVLKYLGIASIKELPEFDSLAKTLKEYE